MVNPSRPSEGPRSHSSIRDRIEAKLRQGYRPRGMAGSGDGAIQAAAKEAVAEGEFDTEKAFASAAYGLPPEFAPDYGLYRPQRYQQPVPLAVVQPAIAPVAMEPSGRPQRILAIGDLHQDPRHPDRLPIMTWLARLASEHRPERTVQIGDWSTNDSVNAHDDNSTEAARYKPKIKDDLDNLLQSHQYFRRGMADDYRPKLDVVLGNHENRLERFENANPEAVGTYTLARDETFAQFGWRTRPVLCSKHT